MRLPVQRARLGSTGARLAALCWLTWRPDALAAVQARLRARGCRRRGRRCAGQGRH